MPVWITQGPPVRRLLLAVAALAAAAGCGHGTSAGAKSPPETFGVVGDLTVRPATADIVKRHVNIDDPCDAASGFEDVHAGTQVVIADEAGKTVALGQLDPGTLAGKAGQDVFSLHCSFSFEVADVPGGHPFYRVSVGRRGSQQFTAAQLQQRVHLSLS